MLDVARTPPATLTRARAIARAHGLRYVYTGNVRDEPGQSTWCDACGAKLIGRDGYEITAWSVSDGGRCERCGTACPGVFDARPGRWGQRRVPLSIGRGAPAPAPL
jgi:pyruvate formate lyase activating enzyme